jgi:hypothetical protein
MEREKERESSSLNDIVFAVYCLVAGKTAEVII